MTKRDHDKIEFLTRSGWGTAQRQALTADASSRRYERLILDKDGIQKQAILMDAPPASELPSCPQNATPQERINLGYNACARLAGVNMHAFSTIAHSLSSYGLSAPNIYAIDEKKGFAVIEDLGDNLYARIVNKSASENELYEHAIDVLIHLHQTKVTVPRDPQYTLMTYDQTAMLAEIDLLTQWYLPLKNIRENITSHQTKYTDENIIKIRNILKNDWISILDRLQTPSVLVLRDYHAENLLWLPNRTPLARTGLLDFQDALIGHRAYDLVSLLEDARRDVEPKFANRMRNYYCEKMGFDKKETKNFEQEYAILGAQRNAKILGIFARLAKRDGKQHYLKLLPRVEAHFRNNIAHPALSSLRPFFADHLPDLLS